MFSPKENRILQDLKKEEELCIEKYTKYENSAASPQLKSLMRQIRSQEQSHLDTLTKILNGEAPPPSGGGNGQQTGPQAQAADYAGDTNGYNNDKYLCTDALGTEKHVSAMYDTSIFAMQSVAVRDALNHIQKEAQEHGETLSSYMMQNGMQD